MPRLIFKATGKPQMILCHGTVGLMHATMAVYNAWCDRVPLMIVGGNDLDAAKRPPGVPTYHSAQDIGVLVRDYTKWDDAPVSHQHFAQSFVRAYKAMMTPPYGPVLISLDAGIQDTPVDPDTSIPKYTAPVAGAGRRRRATRNSKASRECRTSGHRRRPHGARPGRREQSGNACRAVCRFRWSTRAAA